MHMTTARHWIHIAITDNLAHVVRVEFSPLGQPVGARTLTYRDVFELEDFLAYALDEPHSDASGMLMAVEMQGGDDFWLELSDEEHARVRDQVRPMNVDPEETLGLRLEAGRAFAQAGQGSEVELTDLLHVATSSAPL